MITIKRRSTTLNYPFIELVKLIQNSKTSIPLRMVGIKKYLIAPKTTISDSRIYVSERRISAVYYPDRDGNTVVEYSYEIHWLVLILWIITIFPLLVGIILVPLIVISSSSAVTFRINSVNKYAYNALMELNPLTLESKTPSKTEISSNYKSEKASTTPPPIKKQASNTAYFVCVNDEQMGPYDIEKLKLLYEFKNIDESTLIWKEGMEDWDALNNIPELASIFNKS